MTEEEIREMARSNYAAQLAGLGYGPDGMALVKNDATGWISVKDRLPEDQVTVLAVKQLKNGRRDICLARCILEYEHFDVETRTKVISPYWACGGNNTIIYWMPLPGLPEEG